MCRVFFSSNKKLQRFGCNCSSLLSNVEGTENSANWHKFRRSLFINANSINKPWQLIHWCIILPNKITSISDRTVKLASKNSLQWRQKYYIMHKWTSAVSLPFEMKKKENQIVKLIFLSFFWAMIYQFVIGKSLCRRKLLTLWMQRFSDRCWIQSIFNANKLVFMLQFVIRFNFFGVSCNLSTARSFNGVCR